MNTLCLVCLWMLRQTKEYKNINHEHTSILPDHNREGESELRDSQTSGDSGLRLTLGNDPEIVQRKLFHFPHQTCQLQHSQPASSDTDIVQLTDIVLHQDSLDYFEVRFLLHLYFKLNC